MLIQLPDGWEVKKLGDIVDFNPTEKLPKGSIAKKIAMEQLQPYNRKISNYEITNFNGGSKFKNKDTLVARITPCLENGKTAYVDIFEDNEIGFGSTEFIVLREKEYLSDSEFIYYLSISPDFRDKAVKSMTGTSGRQRVQTDELINYDMAIPPLKEQKEIATILSSLDAKIDINKQISNKLDEIAQSLFARWFINFNFPDENGTPYKDSGGTMIDSELGKIPKGWQIKNLDEIATFTNGLAMQKHRPKDNERSLPVVKIKELRQGCFDDSSDRCSYNIASTYKLVNGDVVFSWSGTLLVDMWCGGMCGLNQHLFKITSDSYPKWFYYCWTKHYLEYFIGVAQDKATTMGHIQRKHLSNAKVLIPDTVQLKKLNATISPIVEYFVNTRVESKKLETIRNSLLPKLMSGEIDVTHGV